MMDEYEALQDTESSELHEDDEALKEKNDDGADPQRKENNVKDNQMVVKDYPVTEIVAPDEVMTSAVYASKKLKEIVSGKPKKVVINGEQYLEFEDWQTLGKFYGVCAKTLDAKPVEVNGVKGAYARAEVVLAKTGVVIGGADAYCLQDEPNWKTKPFFQLASMAQTRAAAKALRNVLSWVAVLAGYRPTPAEEMEGVFNGNGKKDEPNTTTPQEQEGFRIMDSKYKGKCKGCGQEIQVGGKIAYSKTKGTFHAECAQ